MPPNVSISPSLVGALVENGAQIANPPDQRNEHLNPDGDGPGIDPPHICGWEPVGSSGWELVGRLAREKSKGEEPAAEGPSMGAPSGLDGCVCVYYS